MAKKKRRKKKPARQAQAEPYPGWVWMLFGLAVGLSVAAAIYMKDRGTNAMTGTAVPAPASMELPIEAEPPVPEPGPEPVAETPAAPEEEPRFSFYSMLPNFEVVIPEEETDVSRDDTVAAIEASGTYVLQAGSFTDAMDADRRRAELALLGVESQIQRIAIDDRVYHRVRIGPISDLDELNRVRGRLRDARIDVLRIRLGE
jgi:cell division protein FtsN